MTMQHILNENRAYFITKLLVLLMRFAMSVGKLYNTVSLLPAANLNNRASYYGKDIITLNEFSNDIIQNPNTLSREELQNRLLQLRHDFYKNVAYSDWKTPHSNSQSKKTCTLKKRIDLQRMLPGRFLSERQLARTVAKRKQWESVNQVTSFYPKRRLLEPSSSAMTYQPAFVNSNIGRMFSKSRKVCGVCATEVGYEVVDQITDYSGMNHTLINFRNAYQFISTGRCLNEHSSCGFGGSRCRQIMRAHWSLVWTERIGVNIVAHEVPSHCECLNLGSNSFLSKQQQQRQGTSSDIAYA